MRPFYKIKVVVIDDEPAVLLDVTEELTASGLFDVTGTYTSVADAVEDARQHGPPDFVLSDIHLSGLSGLHATALFADSFVVLMTGYPESSQAAFGAYPEGCVFKPVSMRQLMPLVTKFYKQQKHDPQEIVGGQLMVKDSKEGDFRPIPVNEICYVEAFSDYVKIFWGKVVWTVHATMREMADKLERTGKFMRISNQHIVAYDRITRIDKKQIYITCRDGPLDVKAMGEKAFAEYMRNVRPGTSKKKAPGDKNGKPKG